MIFPVGDDQVQGGMRPIISYSFIALNVLVYFWQTSDPTGFLYVNELGSVPAEISQGIDLHTMFSSMFMHGGFMHLLGNMVFLWVFGDNIEATIGSLKFLGFYVVGGLAASAAHIILDPQSSIPCVGASGAIAAVMGAYMVMFPKSKIKMLFLLTFSYFRIIAIAFLGFWIVQQVVSGVGALNLFGSEGNDAGGVAYWAHIGGFLFGIAAGFILKPLVKQQLQEQKFNTPVWDRGWRKFR